MLVPELTLANPTEAEGTLTAFGFRESGGLWHLGSQAVRLVEGDAQGHGRIDHIALALPDMDADLAALLAKGIALDPQVTPKGPELIPEFWDAGLRFVYLAGPQGARIELCQRITGAPAEMGHDHIGVPCADLRAMQAFFEAQGARLTTAIDLSRPEGTIPVRFLDFHGGVIELFQPGTTDRAAHGLWSRLLIPGLSASIHGPEGLTLAPF